MKKTSPSPPKKSNFSIHSSHPLSWVWMKTAPLHNQHRVGGLNAQNFFRRGGACSVRISKKKTLVPSAFIRLHLNASIHIQILQVFLKRKKIGSQLARVESPPRLSSCVNYNSFKKIQEIYLPTYTKDHSKENNYGGSTPSSAFHQESTSQRTFAAASRFCKIAKPLKSSKILPPPPSAIST